jgi:MFS transporter, Spinster family, sphingosine-1-phosphate transporter
MSDTPPVPNDTPAVKGRSLALVLLIIVYTLNFLDRQILSILKEPIATEFGLSDTQLGWMGGLAFAALYSTLAIPAAWLADRTSRVWIMTGALTIWSGFTALCGVATNFTQLFISRMGVGVGEAGGVAPAYSLIADYFPAKSRAKALAIYSFGIPVGSAAGVLFGGLMAKTVDWRWAFISIGCLGLLIAPIFRLLVKDPPRVNALAVGEKQLTFPKVAALAFSKPSFWFLAFGSASSSMVGYGVIYWMPTFLARSLHLEIVERSYFYAAILFFGGVAGMALGGYLADKLGQKSKAAYALIPAVAFIVSVPLYALGVMAQTPLQAFCLFMIPQALSLVWLGPVLTAVQHLGPAASRSQMSALFLLINNLIGISLGTYGFGKLSDILKPTYGADSIKYAFLCALAFYVLASLLLVLASRNLKKDWVA